MKTTSTPGSAYGRITASPSINEDEYGNSEFDSRSLMQIDNKGPNAITYTQKLYKKNSSVANAIYNDIRMIGSNRETIKNWEKDQSLSRTPSQMAILRSETFSN